MNEHGKQERTPAFRIWLCGAFRVERRIEVAYEVVRTAEWGGSSYPRLLLKALLCCPGRQARREALIELLWPEAEPEQAAQYLHTATTKLRKVLEPGKGQASLLVTEEDAKHYRLEDTSPIWVDADTALTLLKETERRGRTSQDALPFLEEAATLLRRGTFLDGEEGLWALSKRATIERARYRCQLWLAEAYEQQGMLGQAESVLSQLFEEDSSDEDVLCRLMELLHREGMTQKAFRLYQQTSQGLAREGIPLTDAVKQLAVRLEEQRHGQAMASGTILLATSNVFGLPQRRADTAVYPPSSPLLQETLSASNSGVLSPAPPFDSPAMPQGIVVDSSQSFFLNEATTETLAHFSELLAACRHLSEGNELQVAEQTLWAYLPRIESLAKRSLGDQQDLAAALASQGYLLAASLAGHRNDLQARYHDSEQALLYGKLAGDRNLQIAALRQLSITFDYLERPENVLHIYQQAFPYLNDVSPLLRACVYAGVSGAYAQLHQQTEAFDFMNRAYEHFPSHPEREPDYLHTICRSSTLVFFDGLNYLDLGQPREAEKVLARVDGLHPAMALPERVRIEALNYQIEVFLTLHAMDQACVYLEAAVQAALTIGSKRRLQEAFVLFQRMRELWPNEARVRTVADVFLR